MPHRNNPRIVSAGYISSLCCYSKAWLSRSSFPHNHRAIYTRGARQTTPARKPQAVQTSRSQKICECKKFCDRSLCHQNAQIPIHLSPCKYNTMLERHPMIIYAYTHLHLDSIATLKIKSPTIKRKSTYSPSPSRHQSHPSSVPPETESGPK